MSSKKFKLIFFLLISVLIFGADFSWSDFNFSRFNFRPIIVEASPSLSGRFLIQVEDKGQAWYLNPLNQRRYSLSDPYTALQTLGSLGLGVSNKDFKSFQKIAPRRLAGRIFLKVEDEGQLYYLSPVDLKLHLIASNSDLFNLVKSQGLGISNKNLNRFALAAKNSKLASIVSAESLSLAPLATSVASTGLTQHFTFKYQNISYDISQNLSIAVYNSYQNSPKVYTYTSDSVPVNLREAFYGLFLSQKQTDRSLDDLIANLRTIANQNNWTDDELLEFTMALVQYIPYDQAKVTAGSNRNLNPYYPYETLYLDRGVCSDKTFLAVSLLRKLGYGAAILDFPDINHSAVGIACPVEYSVNGSGYCYGETTNYFPLGVIPQTISGQAQDASNQIASAFNSQNLGRIEIYQSTKGKIYQGVIATQAKINSLKSTKEDLKTRQLDLDSFNASVRQKETELNQLKTQMDGYSNSGQTTQYNNLVSSYNNLVAAYNLTLSDYKLKVDQYNQVANSFNQLVKDFYQK